MNIKEITFICIISIALGVFWSGYSILYSIMSPWLKILALEDITSGVWLMGGCFFPYIIRKKGSGILGESLAAAIQAGISKWGIISILYGIIQGVAAELIFLCFRYKRWDKLTMSLAGLSSGIVSFFVTYFLYQHYKLSFNYNLIQLIVISISGIFIAGLFSKFLADKIFKTGITRYLTETN